MGPVGSTWLVKVKVLVIVGTGGKFSRSTRLLASPSGWFLALVRISVGRRPAFGAGGPIPEATRAAAMPNIPVAGFHASSPGQLQGRQFWGKNNEIS